MRPVEIFWIAALLSVACAAQAIADTPPFWPDAVDTIEVVSPRPFPEEQIGKPRGFVQVVRLGSEVPASCDLGDLLDHAVGVQVRRYGGAGSIQLASVRGSSPSQVEIRIDDAPVSTGADAMADLSFLPTCLFERAEIARGPVTSTEAGSGAGVIRLRSNQDVGGPLHLRIGAGSFGTSSLTASGGFARDGLAVFASAGSVASRGDYPYLDRGGTPYEPGDDRTVRRENNAFRQSDMLFQGRYRVGERLRAGYLGHGLWRDAGIPGTESSQTERVHDRFRRFLQIVTLEADGPASTGWKLLLRRQDDRDRYKNLDGEVGLGRSDTRSGLTTQGAEVGASILVPRTATTLRILGSLQDEIWEGRDLLADRDEPDHRRTAGSLDLEAVSRHFGRVELMARERWLFSPAGESGESDLRIPRIGFSLEPKRGVVVRAGWGRFARLPSFVERYGRGGVQIGNPALVAERGEGWDIGGSANVSVGSGAALRCRVESAYFENRTNDAIVWLQNSQRTSRPENLDRTRVRGLELLMRAAYRTGETPCFTDPAFDLTTSCTLQEPRDVGPSMTYNGKTLPYIPAEKVSIQSGVDVGKLRVEHLLDCESSFYRDRYNSPAKRRGPRILQDGKIVLSLRNHDLELLFWVRNMTDLHSQDVEGFPLPGRSFHLEVTFSTSVGSDGDRS